MDHFVERFRAKDLFHYLLYFLWIVEIRNREDDNVDFFWKIIFVVPLLFEKFLVLKTWTWQSISPNSVQFWNIFAENFEENFWVKTVDFVLRQSESLLSVVITVIVFVIVLTTVSVDNKRYQFHNPHGALCTFLSTL